MAVDSLALYRGDIYKIVMQLDNDYYLLYPYDKQGDAIPVYSRDISKIEYQTRLEKLLKKIEL